MARTMSGGGVSGLVTGDPWGQAVGLGCLTRSAMLLPASIDSRL